MRPWESALRKRAAALGSALPDPVKDMGALAPVPTPVFANKTAPGQTGPKGMMPRTTYSRVNTGSMPTPDAGATAQKGSPPRGSEFLPAKMAQAGHEHEEGFMKSIAARPNLQQLVKAAMAGTISKADISAEALRQSGVSDPQPPQEQDASHVPTEKVAQLAAAVGYLAKLADQGNIQMPGEGPGALGVLQATSSEKNIDAGEGGQATAAHIPPKNPPLQKEEVQVGKADTGLKTNDEMSHPEQPKDPWSNEKATLQNAYTKQSSAGLLERNYLRLLQFGEEKVASHVPVSEIRKFAEDAIYPANISAAHHEVPPPAVPAEQGKVSVPSDARSQMKMVGSNQAAIDYTKGEAKADPKRDLSQVLNEPALSASRDKVLQKTLDHTRDAGVKISMARDANRVAAARALMSNLLKEAEASCPSDKGKGKKEKESMMGAAPSSPSQIPNPIQ